MHAQPGPKQYDGHDPRYQSDGNICVVLYQRPDGRFAVFGVEGAHIYRSAKHYEWYYEGGQPEPDHVYWSD